MEDFRTGFAIWQLSKILSECENELWLKDNIDLFYLPEKLGGDFIFFVKLSSSAIFGVDLETLQGGTVVPIKEELQGLPIYRVFKLKNYNLTDSDLYNYTAINYLNEYNINILIMFLVQFSLNSYILSPDIGLFDGFFFESNLIQKNEISNKFLSSLNEPLFDSKTFTEYISDKN